VYDALNVLFALDVIHKDRNKITFRGFQNLLEMAQVNSIMASIDDGYEPESL